MRSLRIPVLLTLVILVPNIYSVAAQQDQRKVLLVEVRDIIGSATVEQVSTAVQEAKNGEYSAIVIALSTPGGLVDSMFKIVDEMQSSPVPVIGFVYPSGGQALSAGTYILMSADYAAMAPFTRIGSAQPVAGGVPVNETKIINALTKQMEGFAQLHKRNSTQLTRFISHNDNLLPEEALSRHVIESIAATPEELLEKADGMSLNTLKGERVLHTKGASIVRLGDSPRITIVRAFSDPIISNLLVGIGILIVILGLSTPGWGAEVLGAVLLILGLLGQGFNVNYVALALMGIGAALLVFELHAPGFGIPGVGGIILLALGMLLFVTRPPGPVLINPGYFEGLLQTLIASYALAGAAFALMIYKFAQVRRMKSKIAVHPSGVGRAVDEIAPGREGYVNVGGEYWKAKTSHIIKSGDRVKVLGHENGVLIVEPA